MLQLLAIGIDCKKFDFIDSPDEQSIELALNQLLTLGAVSTGKQTELTELGRKMAKFPLDPKYSKILLMAPTFGCLEEVSQSFQISFKLTYNLIQSFNIKYAQFRNFCLKNFCTPGIKHRCAFIGRRCVHKQYSRY